MNPNNITASEIHNLIDAAADLAASRRQPKFAALTNDPLPRDAEFEADRWLSSSQIKCMLTSHAVKCAQMGHLEVRHATPQEQAHHTAGIRYMYRLHTDHSCGVFQSKRSLTKKVLNLKRRPSDTVVQRLISGMSEMGMLDTEGNQVRLKNVEIKNVVSREVLMNTPLQQLDTVIEQMTQRLATIPKNGKTYKAYKPLRSDTKIANFWFKAEDVAGEKGKGLLRKMVSKGRIEARRVSEPTSPKADYEYRFMSSPTLTTYMDECEFWAELSVSETTYSSLKIGPRAILNMLIQKGMVEVNPRDRNKMRLAKA